MHDLHIIYELVLNEHALNCLFTKILRLRMLTFKIEYLAKLKFHHKFDFIIYNSSSH